MKNFVLVTEKGDKSAFYHTIRGQEEEKEEEKEKEKQQKAFNPNIENNHSRGSTTRLKPDRYE